MTGVPADDLAAAALALARRFADGATLWAWSPAAPAHARHVAVEFIHPVVVGKRALPAVAVPGEAAATAALRASVRSGDVVVVIGRGDDAAVLDVLRRAPAWGLETIWIAGPPAPGPGLADHVLCIDTDVTDPLSADVVRCYHLLWELAHVCLERPAALRRTAEATAELTATCATCADEGVLGEVEAVRDGDAVVRTADGRHRVDTTLIEPPAPGDLVLIHAGTAIAAGEPRCPEVRP